MSLSSPTFLFAFLPLLLIATAVAPTLVLKNFALLAANVAFAAWFEGPWAGFMIGSAVFAWAWAWLLDRQHGPARKILGWLGCLALLLELAAFKLGPFVLACRHSQSGALSPADIPAPLALSLVLLQACAYLSAVQRAQAPAESSLGGYLLGSSFFAALSGGLLVRYQDIRNQVLERETRAEDFYSGALRFSFGLAKKVVLADSLGTGVDRIWQLGPESLSAPLILAAVLFSSMQLYLSLSGLADMACGLGLLFGFHLPENFKYPHCATSVHDFWRRWQISLADGFRQAVAALDQRRLGRWQGPLTLAAFILFFQLCYGASWSLLLASAWFGLFLGLERFLAPRLGWRPSRWAGWAGTQAVLLIGGLFVRSSTATVARIFLQGLCGRPGTYALPVAYFLQPAHWFLFLSALAVSLGLWPRLRAWVSIHGGSNGAGVLEAAAGGLCLLLALARIGSGAALPFSFLRF